MRWVQFCCSLSILWHCLSLGLEWKLTFSSPVATAEFSKFAGHWVQHFHSIIFQDLKQLNWNSITSTSFVQLCFLRPTWLHIPGCLALGEWSHHRDYLGHEDLFVQFVCVFLLPLLNIFCFCYVHTISVLYRAHLCMKCSLLSLIFLKRSLVFPILLLPSISLHWSLRKAFLSLLHILWKSAFK